MPRHTVSARTYVSLNGSANPGWGLELRTSAAGAGNIRVMDVYTQGPGAGWTPLAAVGFFPDYSGVMTLGGAEQIGRSFALATIPRGTPMSGLEVSSRITLGQGDFLIGGSSRADVWNGVRGRNDEIWGFGGNDTLNGGAGGDTISGGDGNDLLYGGPGNDLLNADGGRDTLFGGLGNDNLRGGWGHRLVGGLGNDSYETASPGSIVELANGGIDTVYTWEDLRLPEHVENLVLARMTDAVVGHGNALGNRIEGNAEDNTLWGLDGNDSLHGSTGDDTLLGGNGNDLLQGDSGDDVLRGGEGIDTAVYAGSLPFRVDLSIKDWQATGQGRDMLAGIENLTSGAGDDTLIGDAGANVLSGGAGRDSLIGGSGNDTLNGGVGADTLLGGAGNDVYWVDHAGDVVTELAGGGFDRINASIGIDLTRLAFIEHVALVGSGAIGAWGSAGNNMLAGNAAANWLSGRAGDDVLTGGAGADVFVFGRGFDRDRITDFQDGIDRIRLQGLADLGTVDQVRAHATQVGADVVLDLGDGDVLTVQAIRIEALLDDLVFA